MQAASLLLVTGQATAGRLGNAVLRIGDGVGTNSEAPRGFTGIRKPSLLMGCAVLVAATVDALDDGSGSRSTLLLAQNIHPAARETVKSSRGCCWTRIKGPSRVA